MAGVETLKTIFDPKKVAVLQVFAQQPDEEFTLKEVVNQSDVPLATTHRILKSLTDMRVVRKRKVKHLTTYELRQTDDAEYLQRLLYEEPAPLAKFVDMVSSTPGIQSIIMHGKEEEDRANVVIIGTDINKDAVNAAVAQILEEENYTINHLILEPEQFGMLESMGQFSGSKTALFSR